MTRDPGDGSVKADELAEVLSEGLDLCARAKLLDAQIERALQAGMGRIFPEGTRCGTPALWVQQQYDMDLDAWEKKAREVMTRLGYAK
jgi:hypothetical protein